MKKLLVVLMLILSTNQQILAESIELERQECSSTTVFKNNDWRLIGLPCDPQGKTVIELFEEEKFGKYDKTWSIFAYNTRLNIYEKLSEDDVMESHKGYWFIQKSGTDKVYTMTGKTVSLTTDNDCDSSKGCTGMGEMGETWSLLVNPFHKSVKSSMIKWYHQEYAANGLTWKEASKQKFISSHVWVYKSGRYIKKDMNNPETTIDPWDAFWIRTKKYYEDNPVFPKVEYPQDSAPLSSLFYQPLLKDTNTTNISWNYVFSEMKKSKMDTLILQWSKLGNLDWENNVTEYDYLEKSVMDVENNKTTLWLQEILEKAKNYNIKVVIGLYHDEKFFEKTNTQNVSLTSSELRKYFNELVNNHIKHAKNINNFVNEHNLTFNGWYIPDEYDNVNFNDKKRQEILNNYLKKLANNLENVSKQKYTKNISAFFNSHDSDGMSPKAYVKMLSKAINGKYTLILHSGLGTSNTDMDGAIEYIKAFKHYYKGEFIPLIEGFKDEGTVMNIQEFGKQIDEIVKTTEQTGFSLFSFRYFFYYKKSLLNFYQQRYIDKKEINITDKAEINTKKIKLPEDGSYYHGAFPNTRQVDSSEDNVTLEGIENYEQVSGKKLAWVYFSHNWHISNSNDTSSRKFPLKQATLISKHGSIPFIRIMTRTSDENPIPDPTYALNKINNGEFDDDFIAWGKAAKDFAQPLIVEWGTEMNGNWFTWNAENYRDDSNHINIEEGKKSFKNAYRRIIKLIENQGATNITWVYHANSIDTSYASCEELSDYYPGHDVIDWLGISVYGPQEPIQTEDNNWIEFNETMQPIYDCLTDKNNIGYIGKGNKPIMLLEFGVTSGYPNHTQEDWAEKALNDIFSDKWPKLKGFAWWNQKWYNYNERGTEVLSTSNMRIQENEKLKNIFQEILNNNSEYLVTDIGFE